MASMQNRRNSCESSCRPGRIVWAISTMNAQSAIALRTREVHALLKFETMMRGEKEPLLSDLNVMSIVCFIVHVMQNVFLIRTWPVAHNQLSVPVVETLRTFRHVVLVRSEVPDQGRRMQQHLERAVEEAGVA